jgi:uncharacterized peroxidase-related enzyme
MPFIKLDQRFDGIIQLFMFDRKVAKNLSAMAQDMMRRPAVLKGKHKTSLTPADRELIAAYVSKGNACQFCYRSHMACAEVLQHQQRGPNAAMMVAEVVEDNEFGNLSPKMAALLDYSEVVRTLDRDAMAAAVAEAREHGATDQDIHDTAFITAFFSMCNRYVDSLATTFQEGRPEEGGKGLADYGYLMTIRRFFKQVLPILLGSKKSPALTTGQ